jgi:hypothetical protein
MLPDPDTAPHTAWTRFIEYQRLVGQAAAPEAVRRAREVWEAAAAAEVARLQAGLSSEVEAPAVRAGFAEIAPGLWLRAALVVAVRRGSEANSGSYVHTVDDGWKEGASWHSPYPPAVVLDALAGADRLAAERRTQ